MLSILPILTVVCDDCLTILQTARQNTNITELNGLRVERCQKELTSALFQILWGHTVGVFTHSNMGTMKYTEKGAFTDLRILSFRYLLAMKEKIKRQPLSPVRTEVHDSPFGRVGSNSDCNRFGMVKSTFRWVCTSISLCNHVKKGSSACDLSPKIN